MIRWYGTVLAALEFAILHGTAVWAQDAAKPEAPSGSGLLSLLLIFSPLLIVIIILVPMMRRVKRNSEHIERSMEIFEEMLLLARQQAAMQAETNHLLGQLVEVLGRDRGD